MPVTAVLSQKFYEKFGEDLTNELVNWLNAVDATYRADLRELNELHFARFDAKLEQRLAELRADLTMGLHELRATVRTEMTQGLGALKSELLKWMFGFWTTTILALVALFFHR